MGCGAGAGLGRRDAQGAERLGHHVERGHARDHAKDLADPAQGVAAQGDDLARGGGGDVGPAHRIVPEAAR